MQNVLVLVVLVVVGGAVYLAVARRAKGKQAQQLEEARSAGWQFTSLQRGSTSGHEYRGVEEGISWQMEATRTILQAASYQGSDTTDKYETRWFSEAGAIPEGLILLGSRPGGTASPVKMGDLGGRLVQAALRVMVGEEAAEMPALKEMSLPAQLQKRYMGYAHDRLLAQRMFTGEVEELLAAWPEKYPLVVKINRLRAEVRVDHHQLREMETLKHLVSLGVQIVRALQGSEIDQARG